MIAPLDCPDIVFDHVGIVVPDLEFGCTALTGTLRPRAWTQRFDDVRLGVSVRFAQDIAGVVYEVIAPLGSNSPILSALAKGHHIHQLAYRTSSLDRAVMRLRIDRWAVPTGTAVPALAFGGARVQFLMTRLGFVIELIESDCVVHEFAATI